MMVFSQNNVVHGSGYLFVGRKLESELQIRHKWQFNLFTSSELFLDKCLKCSFYYIKIPIFHLPLDSQ